MYRIRMCVAVFRRRRTVYNNTRSLGFVSAKCSQRGFFFLKSCVFIKIHKGVKHVWLLFMGIFRTNYQTNFHLYYHVGSENTRENFSLSSTSRAFARVYVLFSRVSNKRWLLLLLLPLPLPYPILPKGIGNFNRFSFFVT